MITQCSIYFISSSDFRCDLRRKLNTADHRYFCDGRVRYCLNDAVIVFRGKRSTPKWNFPINRSATVQTISTLAHGFPGEVGSPIAPCQCSKGIWLVTIVGRLPCFCAACSESGHRHFELGGFAKTTFSDERIAYQPLLQASWQAIFFEVRFSRAPSCDFPRASP